MDGSGSAESFGVETEVEPAPTSWDSQEGQAGREGEDKETDGGKEREKEEDEEKEINLESNEETNKDEPSILTRP